MPAKQQASPHNLLEIPLQMPLSSPYLLESSEYIWHPFPMQVAEQQGAYLAKELNKLAQAESQAAAMPPFEFKQIGSMAQVGELGGLTARVLGHRP